MVEKKLKSDGEKKSIRNIPLTKKQARELEKIEEQMGDGTGTIQVPTPPVMVRPQRVAPQKPTAKKSQINTEKPIELKKKRKGKTGWVVGVVVCLILIWGVGHVLAKATVSITGSQEVAVLSDTQIPLVLNTATTTSEGAVLYQKKTVSFSATTTIAAIGQQTVQTKASGKLVVYNTSSASQQLIATTRFETPEGLIFKLDKGIVVPAKSNVTVSVTADQPGQKYNIGPKNFTLPGFRGTAKAKTIYGKSTTSMTGGTQTTAPKTAATELSSAKLLLQDTIKKEAEKKAIEDLPEGYVYLSNSISIKLGDVKQTYDQASKKAKLSQGAVVSVYYLEKESLEAAISAKTTEFASLGSKANIDTSSLAATAFTGTGTSTSAHLTGSATVKANIKAVDIASKVAGMSRSEALQALQNIVGVETAEISLRPWWEMKLPGNDAITVEIR